MNHLFFGSRVVVNATYSTFKNSFVSEHLASEKDITWISEYAFTRTAFIICVWGFSSEQIKLCFLVDYYLFETMTSSAKWHCFEQFCCYVWSRSSQNLSLFLVTRIRRDGLRCVVMIVQVCSFSSFSLTCFSRYILFQLPILFLFFLGNYFSKVFITVKKNYFFGTYKILTRTHKSISLIV